MVAFSLWSFIWTSCVWFNITSCNPTTSDIQISWLMQTLLNLITIINTTKKHPLHLIHTSQFMTPVRYIPPYSSITNITNHISHQTLAFQVHTKYTDQTFRPSTHYYCPSKDIFASWILISKLLKIQDFSYWWTLTHLSKQLWTHIYNHLIRNVSINLFMSSNKNLNLSGCKSQHLYSTRQIICRPHPRRVFYYLHPSRVFKILLPYY